MDTTDIQRNVVVFEPPLPSNVSEFFAHIILTMGHFTTELDVYSQPNMTAAFRAAHLIAADDPNETGVKEITRKYVTDQLLWYPFGSQTFSKHLDDALQTIQTILLAPQLQNQLPSATEEEVADAIQHDLVNHERFLRHAAVDALRGEHIPQFPDVKELKEGAVLFQPQITSVHNQSAVSVHEQTMALNTCINAINHQHNQQASHPNCFVLLGPPGAGKTHILLIAMTYALSRNIGALLVAITSLEESTFICSSTFQS